MPHIPNDALSLDAIPAADGSIEDIGRFGGCFNGYEHWGSFERCAEIANAERHETLTDLRTCLFFEQRRWRHYGDFPDEEAQAYWRTLVKKIRAKVRRGELS